MSGTLGLAPLVYNTDYNDYNIIYQLSQALGSDVKIKSMLYNSGYYDDKPELPFYNNLLFFDDYTYGDGAYNLQTAANFTFDDLMTDYD